MIYLQSKIQFENGINSEERGPEFISFSSHLDSGSLALPFPLWAAPSST